MRKHEHFIKKASRGSKLPSHARPDYCSSFVRVRWYAQLSIKHI